MIKKLKALLGKTLHEHPAKKPTPTSKPSSIGSDYRAVSLVPGMVECCTAAKEASGKRYLMRKAPRLPLADCTVPTNCSCTFRRHPDRRHEDRRLLGGTDTSGWLAGPERRKGGSRRSTKG